MDCSQLSTFYGHQGRGFLPRPPSSLLNARHGSTEGQPEVSLINKSGTCLWLCILCSPKICPFTAIHLDPKAKCRVSKWWWKPSVMFCRAAAKVNSSCLGHVIERPPHRERAVSWLISPNIGLIEDSVPAMHISLKQTYTHAHIRTYFMHEWTPYTTHVHATHFSHKHSIHLLLLTCFLSASSTCFLPFVAELKSLMQQTKKPFSMYYLASSSY